MRRLIYFTEQDIQNLIEGKDVSCDINGINTIIVSPKKNQTKDALKIALNDDDEYKRLTDIFDAKYNTYGLSTEINIYEALTKIVLAGLDTTGIKDIKMVEILMLSIDAGLFNNEKR